MWKLGTKIKRNVAKIGKQSTLKKILSHNWNKIFSRPYQKKREEEILTHIIDNNLNQRAHSVANNSEYLFKCPKAIIPFIPLVTVDNQEEVEEDDEEEKEEKNFPTFIGKGLEGRNFFSTIVGVFFEVYQC